MSIEKRALNYLLYFLAGFSEADIFPEGRALPDLPDIDA